MEYHEVFFFLFFWWIEKIQLQDAMKVFKIKRNCWFFKDQRPHNILLQSL